MRRLSFGLLLAGWIGVAVADWTLMGGITDIYSAYADTASVRAIGPGHVEMWGLYNFSRPDIAVTGHQHRSTRSLREYDCDMPRVRLLSVVDYSASMGTGAPIPADTTDGTRPPGRWEDIVSGAVDEAFWKAACRK